MARSIPQQHRGVPSLQHHTASGQGVLCFNGKDHYCGPWGAPECRAKYHRLVADWLASDPALPEDRVASVAELVAAYMRWAVGYYRKDGQVTSEVDAIRTVVRYLKPWGDTFPNEFGPRALYLDAAQQGVRVAGAPAAFAVKRIARCPEHEIAVGIPDAQFGLNAAIPLDANFVVVRFAPAGQVARAFRTRQGPGDS